MNTDTANVKKEMVFEVTNGPNRDALFDSCKYAYEIDAHVGIKFEVVDSSEAEREVRVLKGVKVYSIQHEDGSGQSFNIEGWYKAKTQTVGCGRLDSDVYTFRGYYNAKTRKGFLKFKAQ